jgi:adenosylcobinamide hydrolase
MDYSIEKNNEYVLIKFDGPRRTLSSAVYNGGFIQADNILNFRVEKTSDGKRYDPPEQTLELHCDKLGLSGITVGLMTAASMKSFRRTSICKKGVNVDCILTSGVENARCAGDPSDFDNINGGLPPGTINIVLVTNANLSDSTFAECIMTVSEAKAAALRELDVRSPATGNIATGTGTDSIVIVGGSGEKIRYAGKHVLFGEMIAKSVIHSLTASINSYSEEK